MRITNGMMISSSLSNLNGALTRVSKYNNQLASNRKILTLSDSPVGVLNSMGARSQIRRLEQYQRNVDASRSWIQQVESAVTEMEELTISIRELLTDSMGTENKEDKAIFATQLRQYTHSLLELCNSSNGSQYMFGGYNVTQQPFTATYDSNGNITGVKYNGLDLTGLSAQPSTALSKLDKLEMPTQVDGVPSASPNAGTTLADKLTWGGNMTMNGTFIVQDVTSKQVQKTDSEGNPVLDEDGNKVMETVMEFTFQQVQDNQMAPDGKTPAYPELETDPKPERVTVTVNLSEALASYDGSAQQLTLKLNTEDGESFGSLSMNVFKELDSASLPEDLGAMLQTAIMGATEGGSVPVPSAMPSIVDDGQKVAENVMWAGPTDLNGEYEISASSAGDGVVKFILTEKVDENAPSDIKPKQYTIEADIRTALGKLGAYGGDGLNVSIPLSAVDGDGNAADAGTLQFRIADGISDNDGKLMNMDAIAGLIAGGIAKLSPEQLPSMQTPPVVIQSASVSNAAATTGPKAPAGLNWSGSIRDTTQKYTLGVETNKDGQATGITFTNSYGSVVHTAPVGDIVATSMPNKYLVGPDDKELTGANGTPITNTRYTLDLSKEGYGVVTWTTQDMVNNALQNGATAEDMVKKLDSQYFPTNTDLANFVSSAGYVASNIGNEASQRLQFEVGHNIMTDVTFTGIDLVGTGEENLFKLMIDLADMLDNNARNEDLTVYITKITNKQDQLLTAMVKCGNRDNKMTTMANRYKLDSINYEANRSNIEDIDQAEVITKMKFAEVIYKQALAASAQIIQPTLMDFLR